MAAGDPPAKQRDLGFVAAKARPFAENVHRIARAVNGFGVSQPEQCNGTANEWMLTNANEAVGVLSLFGKKFAVKINPIGTQQAVARNYLPTRHQAILGKGSFIVKIIAFLLLLAAPILAQPTGIHPGDSLADVQAALGAPQGQAQLSDKLVLFYDRGQVQLVDGKVTSSSFLSPNDFAAQQAQQKADDAEAAQLRAQRMAEGQALMAQVHADPAFASAPLAYQLTFWQNFRLRYPEVSCDYEYRLVVARLQAQLAAQGAAAENAVSQTYDNMPYSAPFYDSYTPSYYRYTSYYQFREHEREDNDRDHRDGRDRHLPWANAKATSPSFVPRAQNPAPTFNIPRAQNPAPTFNVPSVRF